ncbi:hypothetical protein ACFDR9_005445 [Janthinobacterium sp. CG_23.3]
MVVGDRLIFRYFIDKLERQSDAAQALTYHRIFLESLCKSVCYRGKYSPIDEPLKQKRLTRRSG